jgi:RNA polymerase sigma factor for flagellar operon FliA
MPAAPLPPPGAGEALYLEHRATIERVIAFICRRHRLSLDECEDFSSEVRVRLVENDYEVLRRHQGRSSLATYLTVVVHRLLLDHRVRAWGKWRPSSEARRAGPIGVLLDQLLSRDGLTVSEAIGVIESKHGPDIDRDDLTRLAARLPVRVRRTFESDNGLIDMPARGPSPDAGLLQRDAQALADRLARALSIHTSHLSLADQLLLRMRFEDGRTVAQIAALLHLDAKPLYRRLERLIGALRKKLEAEGLTSRDLDALLANDGYVAWTATQERDTRGPSLIGGL